MMGETTLMSGITEASCPEEEDVKQIVSDALNELHSRDRGNKEG